VVEPVAAHPWFEAGQLVAAGALRRVQGQVGVAQRLGGGGVARVVEQADARGEVQLAVARQVRRAQAVEGVLRHLEGPFRCRRRQQDRELVAAEARQHVTAVDGPL
jgi:hypothetical protein